VGAWLPLLARTYRPALALLGTLAAESCILAFLVVPAVVAARTEGMGAYQPVPLATMVATATLASRVPGRIGWRVGVAAGGYLMVVGLTQNSSTTYLTDLVLFYLVVTAAAVGVWRSGQAERARREARRREAETQEAVLEERLRIARELHDVLAHNLTLVNAQAGVARYLMRTDAAAADRALGDITRHTGRAIDDLRATIGLLRRRGDDEADAGLRPVPGLAALDELVGALAAAGTAVTVTRTGEPVELAQHVDLAAYRIVQEASTNAAKHAPGAPVEVALAWSADGVRLRVANPLRPDPATARRPAPGTGHGLIGMRERAGSVGGTFRAGHTPGGEFEVVATLPAAARDHPDRAARPDHPRPDPGDDR
jgi:signal transduction histidine kinase